MKKSFVFVIAVILTALLAVSVSADAQLISDYASAKDGDLLFIADFSSKNSVFNPVPNDIAEDGVTYTVSDGGYTLNVKGNEGYDSQRFYYGCDIEGLGFNKSSCITMVYKVRMNGEIGKNNSIGIGGLGWNMDGSTTDWRFFQNYGNYNSVFEGGANEMNRTALSVSTQKYNSDYTNGIEQAISDSEGFQFCRIDFDGPNQMIRAYAMTANGWALLEEQAMREPVDAYADVYTDEPSVGFYVYTYYEVVDATIKDVRYYKGIGLSAEQLEVTSASSAEEAPAAADVVTPAAAPQTFDASVTAAVILMACAAGVVLTKKR